MKKQMAKTQLTRDIEEALYFYGLEQGEIIVEEVSMPDDWGIVDTLACRTKPDGTHEWRCYELKVSRSDFKSTAKISFIGHYNYYVMSKILYDTVKDEIPSHVGVMVYLPFDSELFAPQKAASSTRPDFLLVPNEREGDTLTKGSLSIIKKASRQELLVEEGQLMNSFLHSLFREVRKAKKLEKGLQLYQSDELFRELTKRYKGYDVGHPERNFYDAFTAEIEQEAVKELRDELDATITESNELKEKMRQNRRMTEPYL